MVALPATVVSEPGAGEAASGAIQGATNAVSSVATLGTTEIIIISVVVAVAVVGIIIWIVLKKRNSTKGQSPYGHGGVHPIGRHYAPVAAGESYMTEVTRNAAAGERASRTKEEPQVAEVPTTPPGYRAELDYSSERGPAELHASTPSIAVFPPDYNASHEVEVPEQIRIAPRSRGELPG